MPAIANPFFYKVVTDYSAAISCHIGKYVEESEVQKDLHQETIIKIWRSIDTYNPQRGGVYTWVTEIARNTCIDHLRRQKNRNLVRSVDNTEAICQDLDGKIDQKRKLQEICRRLPLNQQEILILIYVRDLTQQQAASLLGLPLGTLKSRQRLAISNLRKIYRWAKEEM